MAQGATNQPQLYFGLSEPKVTVFTASGTYTPTPGLLFAVIEAVGAGGGGGGTADSTGYSTGGGGGGGGYSRTIASADDIGASQVLTIGAGGAGGAAGNNAGVAGGDTSVGSLCIGKGGSGGSGCAANAQSFGGAGGVAGTGDVEIQGGVGGNGGGGTATNVTEQSGGGGRSWFGSGTRETRYTIGNGVAATTYGDGGSGGESKQSSGSASGGDGFDGFVVITEYFQANTHATPLTFTGTGAVVKNDSPNFQNTPTGTITSGTYTPTLTAGSNCASIVLAGANYTRIGNIVTVALRFTVGVTLANVNTEFGISLPIASNLGAQEDCPGNMGFLLSDWQGLVQGDSTNDRASANFRAADTTARPGSAVFQYEII